MAPTRRPRAAGLVIAIATFAALLRPATAAAQDATDELQRLRAAYSRAERAESTFQMLRDGGDRYGDSLSAAGVTVHFAATALDDENRASLAEGLEQGAATLRARLGEAGATLVDSAHWYLQGYRGVSGRLAQYELAASPRMTFQRIRLDGPIDPAEVARFVVRAAGDRLATVAPAVAQYARATIDLAPTEAVFEQVGRELSLTWSAAGRRCARGSIEGCRAVLTRASGAEALSLWFDPSDHRAVIVAASMPPAGLDSAFYAERHRCYEGDDAACTRLVPRVPVKDPFSTNVRASFVAHALEVGGAGALDRLRAASAAGVDPITMLATTAGTEPESLIGGWQARSAAALADGRSPMLPVVLTTAAWCGVLLVGATRRKP